MNLIVFFLIIFYALLIGSSYYIIQYQIERRKEEQGRNKYGFTTNIYKADPFVCKIDNRFGIYDSLNECQIAALHAKPRSGINQQCTANKMCNDGLFCNDKNLCERKKALREKCEPGQCNHSLYCDPQTSQCQFKAKPKKRQRCSALFPCTGDYYCGKDKFGKGNICILKPLFQVNVDISPKHMNVNVNKQLMNSKKKGFYVYGFDKNTLLVVTKFYDIENRTIEETQNFINDSYDWNKLNVIFLIFTFYKVSPSKISYQIRQTLQYLGAHIIRYMFEDNYLFITDFRKKRKIYESNQTSITYNHTIKIVP